MSVNWAKPNFALWNCQDCSGSNQNGVFVEAFIVPTCSMEPVIIRGDRNLVLKFHELPGRRGDVIAYIAPNNRMKTYMRCLARKAGQTKDVRCPFRKRFRFR